MRMKVADLRPENPKKWWGFFHFSLFYIFHYFTYYIYWFSRQKDLCLYFCHIDRSRKSRPNTEYSIQKCILFCLSVASRAEVFHWLVRILRKQQDQSHCSLGQYAVALQQSSFALGTSRLAGCRLYRWTIILAWAGTFRDPPAAWTR
jgi:hypothetical protein